jgi:hypothetical protein
MRLWQTRLAEPLAPAPRAVPERDLEHEVGRRINALYEELGPARDPVLDEAQAS